MADDVPHDPADARRSARIGMALFLLYLAMYGGFMYLSAFRPAVMATMIGGANVAIWYGMALIAAPLALATVYLVACFRRDPTDGGASK